MKVIFLAGPYRAETPNGIRLNIIAAERVAAYLWSLGVYVMCPHKNTAFFDGATTDANFLEGAKEFLRRSDAVIFLVDWQESSGSRDEMKLTRELEKPFFILRDYTGESARDFIRSLTDTWETAPPDVCPTCADRGFPPPNRDRACPTCGRSAHSIMVTPDPVDTSFRRPGRCVLIPIPESPYEPPHD